MERILKVVVLLAIGLLALASIAEDRVRAIPAAAPAEVAGQPGMLAMLVVLVFFLLLLVMVVGAGVALFDVSGRREEEAEWLQAKILEGLTRDPALRQLRLVPVVQVSASRRSPVMVELHGEVPTEEHRAEAEAVVSWATRHVRAPISVENRIQVASTHVTRVA